jgi:DEAD/DEAH box helicase domain-containing protein
VQGLLAALFTSGVKAPEVGYELMGADGCVVADCELAWSARKVAVLLTADAKPAFVAVGWKVLIADDPAVLNTLKGWLKAT